MTVFWLVKFKHDCCVLKESAIESKFTEANAVNKQRLQNLEFAQSLLNQVKHINKHHA